MTVNTGGGHRIFSNLRSSAKLLVIQAGKRLFFSLLVSKERQPGVSNHRERDVAIPTVILANFVLIQTCFAFGFFEHLLDAPAGTGNLSQNLRRCLCWSVRQIVGDLAVLKASAQKQPLFPDLVGGRRDSDGCPIIESQSLLPIVIR